jgi:hypothetical protein
MEEWNVGVLEYWIIGAFESREQKTLLQPSKNPSFLLNNIDSPRRTRQCVSAKGRIP